MTTISIAAADLVLNSTQSMAECRADPSCTSSMMSPRLFPTKLFLRWPTGIRERRRKIYRPSPTSTSCSATLKAGARGRSSRQILNFPADLITWGKLSGNILIWDYNVQFSNFFGPFPNLHTLKPNIKFYTDHHVNSLFMQCNGQSGGEMAGLRAYLICKLMWNPDADDSALMDEYLNGYYGAAGPYIRQYIDKMRESLISSGFKLNIFGSPEDAKDAYLSADMLKVYNALFDQAEKAVANNPQLLTRVKIARLPIIVREDPDRTKRSRYTPQHVCAYARRQGIRKTRNEVARHSICEWMQGRRSDAGKRKSHYS